MKKILAIILSVCMLSAVAVVASAAGAKPTATAGWEVYYIDDTTYCSIVEVVSGDVITNEAMAEVANGAFVGTDSCVQVYHNASAGHLCSDNSIGLTPGAKLVFKFNGTGIHLGANFRDMNPMGIEIYVDGQQVTNAYAANECSTDFNGNHIIPTIIAGVDDLTAGNHVVEFVSTTAVRLSADWYEVPTGTTAYENPQTADMTSVFALLGVIACAGVVVASKKH